MEPIRVVWGTGEGPTELAAYDAALADANVHEYNLIELSSVVPADATVEEVGTAPDLGPAGQGLYVVEASATGTGGPVSAALAWARSAEGSGVFYEAGGVEPGEVVADRAMTGLEAGAELRDRQFERPSTRVVETEAEDLSEGYASAVALAVYGESEPLL